MGMAFNSVLIDGLMVDDAETNGLIMVTEEDTTRKKSKSWR